MSDSVWPQRRQPIRLPCPWDSPGKNTGVGCHFLLQCMKVKIEREVAQSCPTLRDPTDCSLPGFSICGIFQARVLEWVANILNNTSCQEHANRNHNEVSFHIKKDSFNKRMSTSIGENVEKLKHPYFVGGDAYGVAPFESSLMTLQKVKHRIIKWFSNSVPRDIHKIN